jgi:hypothetical protein
MMRRALIYMGMLTAKAIKTCHDQTWRLMTEQAEFFARAISGRHCVPFSGGRHAKVLRANRKAFGRVFGV